MYLFDKNINYLTFSAFENFLKSNTEIHLNTYRYIIQCQIQSLKNILFFIGVYHISFHIAFPYLYKRMFIKKA